MTANVRRRAASRAAEAGCVEASAVTRSAYVAVPAGIAVLQKGFARADGAPMAAIRERWPGPAARIRVADDGVSLIEVLAALTVLSIIAAAVIPLLTRQVHLSGDNTSRAAAANIATQSLERLRAAGDDSRPIGTTTEYVTVNRVQYEVTRTLAWVDRAISPGGCPNGGSNTEAVYIRADVVVTWARMQAKPVTSGTLLLPRGRSGGAPSGGLTVKVTTSLGAPSPGHTVTITKPNGTSASRTTDSHGCAFFASLPVGTYHGILSTPGYPVRTASLPITTEAPYFFWTVPYDPV